MTGAAPSTWQYYEEMQSVMGHRPCANEVSPEVAEKDEQGEFISLLASFYYIYILIEQIFLNEYPICFCYEIHDCQFDFSYCSNQ